MGILTHTELDRRRDERPQMNHSKYRTGMQQTKRGNLSWSSIGQHGTALDPHRE